MEPVTGLCLYCMAFKGEHAVCPHCGADAETPVMLGGLPMGHILNKRYIVGRIIGIDDYFVQYLGFDQQTRKKVVVSEFFPRHLVERDRDGVRLQMNGGAVIDAVRAGIERFLEEAKVLSDLDRYPGIIPIVEFFRWNNTGYSVRWYIEGEKLGQYLNRKKGTVPLEEAMQIVEPLMDVLEIFHQKGYFHGNISPHSIFLAADGTVKLLDFNGARFFVGENRYELLEEGYAPPELYSDRLSKGAWCDVYGLAAILYRLLAGSPPPPAMERVLNDSLQPLERREGSAAGKLERTLFKALAVKSEERFPTIERFRRALSGIKERTGMFLRPPAETTRVETVPMTLSFQRILYGLGIGAVALLLAVVVTGIVRIDLPTDLWGAANRIAETPQRTDNGVVTVQTLLHLCGSNTIGAKLAPQLSAEMLKRMGATEVVVRENGAPNERVVQALLQRQPVRILISAHGTGTGFEGLAEHACDIAMASRPIKEKEADAMAQKGFGDMTSYQSEHVIATDGIAVIVNKSNPVEELSIESISALFAGRHDTWDELTAGFAGAVSLHARDDKSGTYDTFAHLVLKKEKLAPEAKRFESNEELSDAVAKNMFAVGFTGLPYIRESKAIAVSDSGAAPLYPTVFSVSTEDYPLSRRLYLYTEQSPRNPTVGRFLEFALSTTGQRVVEEVGFISLIPHLESPRLPDDAPERYVRSVADAKRFSLNFRFRFNSVELDTKSFRDLDRILEVLTQPEYRHRQVRLIGFSDSVGTPEACVGVALKRAGVVADYFIKRGVQVAVSAYGSAAPVASNATEEGRNRNRRVEVWLDNE